MTVALRGANVRGRVGFAIAAVVALAVTAACGSTAPSAAPAATPAPTVVRAPEAGADATPATPKGTPLVTVTGRIGATNAGGALRLDRGELDRLGLLAMTVNDPWAKQHLPLQGTWLRDLIAVARPAPGATTLHITALDDYQVDLRLADVRDQPIFLATRTGSGGDLPVEDGGPTRVVFPDELATRFSPDLWIWNIVSIEVR